MSQKIPELEHLIDILKSLPGVGHKNATKWAYFLLNQDSQYIDIFVNRLKNAHARIRRCKQCSNLSLTDVCNICSDPNRDHSQLCLVSSIEDLQRIEDSGNYTGLYFVLNGEVNPRFPDKPLESFIVLYNYVSMSNFKEVIIATNFTIGGQITARKLLELLETLPVKVYRIGFGLSLNSALDYADDETIKYALINKNYLKG